MTKRSVLREVIEGKKPKALKEGEVVTLAMNKISLLRQGSFGWMYETPPRYLTPDTLEEYKRAIIYLLSNYGAEEIISFYKLRLSQLAGGKAHLRQIPGDIVDKVDALIRVRALIAERKKRTQRAGSITGTLKKEKAQPDHDKINKKASELLKTKDKRNIASIIQEHFGYSRNKVYSALKNHPSGNWK